jgi:hypothetical protein
MNILFLSTVLIPEKNGWLKRHDFYKEIFEKMGGPQVGWKTPKKKEKHHQTLKSKPPKRWAQNQVKII